MQFDRIPAIRRSYEESAADPKLFRHETPLLFSRSDMLHDGRREGDIKLTIGEWQWAVVRVDESQSWELLFEHRCVLDTRSCDLRGVFVPSLKKVRVFELHVGCHPNVQDLV